MVMRRKLYDIFSKNVTYNFVWKLTRQLRSVCIHFILIIEKLNWQNTHQKEGTAQISAQSSFSFLSISSRPIFLSKEFESIYCSSIMQPPPTALRLEQEIKCQESRYHRSSKRWDGSLKTCQIQTTTGGILEKWRVFLNFEIAKFNTKWWNLRYNYNNSWQVAL